MSYADVISGMERTNFALGLAFFAILLFFLIFRTRSALGTYRYLQITMVTVDATYTTVQLFIQERQISEPGLFAMLTTSRYEITTEWLCAYLALYNMTFVMIDFSFLYRMWAVKAPWRIALFSKPIFIALLFAIATLESLTWFFSIYFLYVPTLEGRMRLRAYARREFDVDSMTQVMIMGDYYLADGTLNLVTLAGMATMCAVMSACFGFMVYAFINIFHYLRHAIISEKSMRLQRQLFITLCLQAAVPLVCLYVPCCCGIVLPLVRVDSQPIARASPLLISCFLPLDTAVVLITMADYRRDLIRVLTCFRTPAASAVHAPTPNNES